MLALLYTLVSSQAFGQSSTPWAAESATNAGHNICVADDVAPLVVHDHDVVALLQQQSSLSAGKLRSLATESHYHNPPAIDVDKQKLEQELREIQRQEQQAGEMLETTYVTMYRRELMDGTITRFEDSYEGAGSEADSIRTSRIKGVRPNASGKFPVFLYITGTRDKFGMPQDFEFLTYMAKKGYVAATVEYPNDDVCLHMCQDGGECEKIKFKLEIGNGKVTVFEKARRIQNALDKVCSMKSADCSKGVAVMGHSQGGFITMVLTLLDSRITAIHPMGVGPLFVPDENYEKFRLNDKCLFDDHISKFLPRSKRRYTNGEADEMSHRNEEKDNLGLEDFSGHTCNASSAPVNCIQKDGSGYYIVCEKEYDKESRAAIRSGKIAGHNFFSNQEEVTEDSFLLPGYKHGTAAWNLKPSLDWLAAAAKYSKGTAEATSDDPVSDSKDDEESS
jgi:acetyl esterase/lipase